jgi:hypothetical protein
MKVWSMIEIHISFLLSISILKQCIIEGEQVYILQLVFQKHSKIHAKEGDEPLSSWTRIIHLISYHFYLLVAIFKQKFTVLFPTPPHNLGWAFLSSNVVISL